MSLKKAILKDIDDARNGKVITIPFAQPKLGKHVYSGKNLYHLIGGAGGSGKSAWVDFHYVLSPYSWYLKHGEEENVSLKIILRSMERSKKMRVQKWIALKLYIKHQILIDVPNIMSWGLSKSRLTDDVYQLICTELDWFEQMEDVVEIVDGSTNPTGVFHHAEKYALSQGILYQPQVIDGELKTLKKVDFKNYKVASPDEHRLYGKENLERTYVPKNPRHLTIHVTDHVQAMRGEKGLSDKQNLDTHSSYSRELRDLYNFMIVNVSQLNRGVAETARRVSTELLPEDKDFAGSSNLYFDCDMAGILFNPIKYNMDKIAGYEVKRMESHEGINRLRTFHLLKNTYGADNLIFAYLFVGENGLFNELPKPEQTDYYSYANPAFKLNLTER
jgi:hypothetical protein